MWKFSSLLVIMARCHTFTPLRCTFYVNCLLYIPRYTWHNLSPRHNEILIPHTFSFSPFLPRHSPYLALARVSIYPTVLSIRLSVSFFCARSTSLCFTLCSLYLFLHIYTNFSLAFFRLSLPSLSPLRPLTFHSIHLLYFPVDEYKERQSR